jgi:hypothetical protein
MNDNSVVLKSTSQRHLVHQIVQNLVVDVEWKKKKKKKESAKSILDWQTWRVLGESIEVELRLSC